MKKSLILIAVFASFTASAQELTSKKGTPILPQAGDWSIGIDATPFLNYAGNMFSDAGNTAPSFGFTNGNQIITGKYVVDANTAYRAKLRLGFGSTKTEYEVANDLSTTTPQATATDVVKTSNSNIALGAGIQKWRGQGRLRGYYGAEAMIGLLGGSKTTHEFANAITATNPNPTTAIPGAETPDGYISEAKTKAALNFGLGAFIGAEYFFAPKISLSGEFNWGLNIGGTGATEVTTQSWNGTAVQSVTSVNPGKSSSFGIDTGNVGGSINMNFYF
jgi:hypothetical protein